MHYKILIPVFVFLVNIVNAQRIESDRRGPSTRAFLRDYFTTPVSRVATPAVDGSPFIFDEWLMARIRFMDDVMVDSVYIKLNAYQGKVHYRDEAGDEFQAIGKIKEIKITDSLSPWKNTVFLSGFEKDKHSFFQIMLDGKKIMLLKKVKVNVWETKAMFEEAKKEFQKEDEFYFYVKYELIRQNKSCGQLEETFRNDAAILDFISANDLKCNKEADMRKVTEFINSKQP
jgi:hypothetical protein